MIYKKLFYVATLTFFVSVFFVSVNVVETASKNVGVTKAIHITPMVSAVVLPSAALAAGNNDATPDVVPIDQILLPVGKPVLLVIPTINVDAFIEHIGLTSDGAVGAPEGAFDVSWFDMGASPGQKGSALISGHSGRWKNGWHSVFDNLKTLTSGDAIYVKDDVGTTRTFVVQEMRVYGKDENVPELFNKYDDAYLNIITCHGTWLEAEKTYDKRFVVFAKLL